MSVARPNRGKSDAEFIVTAVKLEKETRSRCTHGPKRYTFYGLQELWQTSRKICDLVTLANAFPPTTKAEAKKRRDRLHGARELIRVYNGQLGSLLDGDVLTPTAGGELAELIRKEDVLLKGVMDSDRKRYANLPD